MTMMCVQCYMEGRQISPRMNESNPPFAIMVFEGESRCKDHLPKEAVGFTVTTQPAPASNTVDLPEQFPPLLRSVPEPVLTDNRFVVEENGEPEQSVVKKALTKKAPAKKSPAKKAPQQRKRTKS